MTSDVTICSAAAVAVGGNGIDSLEAETREATVAKALYAMTLDEVLTRHPWRFSMGQAQLARLVETPLFGFNYAYQLPSDLLSVQYIELAAPYEIFEDMLFCDLAEVNFTYQFRPAESKFPPYFTKLLILELAALFAVALAEDESKADSYDKKAIAQERRARLIDSRQQTSRGVRDENCILTQVRQS